MHSRKIPLIQIYGATETGPLAIYGTPDIAVETAGSLGREGLHCEISLRSELGEVVGEGEDGEIWVKGQNILTRYWNNPEASETAISNGWFRTGDVARKDAEGNYWFTDRVKHVIISGGENIYPAEVERAARNTAGIGELVVVGKADPKWGEVPVIALGKGNDHVTDEEILETCRNSLARFKQPKAIIRTEALPRNAMGKVLVDEVKTIIAGQK